MKKYLIICFIMIITGCSLSKIDNTPKKQVESYLYKYQTLEDEVIQDLNLVVEKETKLDSNQKKQYLAIMKNNFKNMTYEIKDEVKDAEKSIVEVEIVVFNFGKAIKNCDSIDCQIKNMKNTKEKVNYTVYFTVKKYKDNWKVEDLSLEDEEKILGIYSN